MYKEDPPTITLFEASVVSASYSCQEEKMRVDATLRFQYQCNF